MKRVTVIILCGINHLGYCPANCGALLNACPECSVSITIIVATIIVIVVVVLVTVVIATINTTTTSTCIPHHAR